MGHAARCFSFHLFFVCHGLYFSFAKCSYCFRTQLELEETRKQKRALENENSRLSDLIKTFSIQFKHSPHLISAFKDSLSKMAYKLIEQCIKKSMFWNRPMIQR